MNINSFQTDARNVKIVSKTIEHETQTNKLSDWQERESSVTSNHLSFV